MNDRREYDFAEKLAFSRGRAEATHPDTIKALIAGCVEVRITTREQDLRGIDFIATLRRGAEIYIDMKVRKAGCSKYWEPEFFRSNIEPELALEIWSVMPSECCLSGKIGWTLDESKLTHYTLHVFDPSDTTEVFLLPFQLLRMAFIRQFESWTAQFSKLNGRDIQSSGEWQSECVFVPASWVLKAIAAEMRPEVSA